MFEVVTGLTSWPIPTGHQTIPSLEYEGGLRTFGRGLCKSEGKTVSIIELADYIGSTFGDGVARYQCANGTSPLLADRSSSTTNTHSILVMHNRLAPVKVGAQSHLGVIDGRKQCDR